VFLLLLISLNIISIVDSLPVCAHSFVYLCDFFWDFLVVWDNCVVLSDVYAFEYVDVFC